VQKARERTNELLTHGGINMNRKITNRRLRSTNYWS